MVTDAIKKKNNLAFEHFQLNEGYRYTKSFLQSVPDLFPNVTSTLLCEHYRCHPKIIDFCNQEFYRGELNIMTTDQGEKRCFISCQNGTRKSCTKSL